MEPKTIARYQAKWVLPVLGEPIENGIAEVDNGVIRSVDKSHGTQPAVDLGAVALIPGLVNAHSHLEFSRLTEPLGFPGIELADWIRLVVGNRIENSGTPKSAAIRTGIKESISAGVVAIGEIATNPISIADYVGGIQFLVFMEQLGRNKNQFAEKVEAVTTFLGRQHPSTVQTAISPHAPYSVHSALLEQLIALAVKSKKPVAMHLAECQSERQLLEQQSGSFVSLLQDLGGWQPDSFHRSSNILDVLNQLKRADRALVVHGNYLNDREIALIAGHPTRMSIVYCPRTHEYFRHSTYPLEKFFRAGINVAVGTDSRASNPDLNLFSELQAIARRHPQLSPMEILAMGTIAGARSLNLDDRFGSLTPGKSAQMNIVSSGPAGLNGINSLFQGNQFAGRWVTARQVDLQGRGPDTQWAASA